MPNKIVDRINSLISCDLMSLAADGDFDLFAASAHGEFYVREAIKVEHQLLKAQALNYIVVTLQVIWGLTLASTVYFALFHSTLLFMSGLLSISVFLLAYGLAKYATKIDASLETHFATLKTRRDEFVKVCWQACGGMKAED